MLSSCNSLYHIVYCQKRHHIRHGLSVEQRVERFLRFVVGFFIFFVGKGRGVDSRGVGSNFKLVGPSAQEGGTLRNLCVSC